MEEALRTFLQDAYEVSGIVGDRVDWGAREQGSALSAIELHIINKRRTGHMQGRDPAVRALVQIDCIAPDFAGAERLARAVIAALDTLNGLPFIAPPAETDQRGPTFEPGSDGAEDQYRASLDVRLLAYDAA